MSENNAFTSAAELLRLARKRPKTAMFLAGLSLVAFFAWIYYSNNQYHPLIDSVVTDGGQSTVVSGDGKLRIAGKTATTGDQSPAISGDNATVTYGSQAVEKGKRKK